MSMVSGWPIISSWRYPKIFGSRIGEQDCALIVDRENGVGSSFGNYLREVA
jgi:hypothetical protein